MKIKNILFALLAFFMLFVGDANAQTGTPCQSSFYHTSTMGGVNNYSFFDYSSGNINNWLWDFGDGTTSTQQNPTHTYSSSNFYQVCLTVEEIDASGAIVCTDTQCDSIWVWGSSVSVCQASFNYYPINPSPNTVPVVIQFQNWVSQGNITNWLWDFGDGTTGTGQNITHSYTVPGTYWACLTIEEIDATGTVICTDTYCDSIWADTVVINAPCSADFSSAQVAISDSTYFTNLSSASATATYFWDFGDGITSTDENPVHLYAQYGWYNVCLTVIDSATNCYDTYCSYTHVIVTGGNGCQAYFLPSLPGGTSNYYNFSNYSTGNITNWLWDFGDGTTSTLPYATHDYSSSPSGFYQVCLTLEELDNNGTIVCTDTYCDSIYVGCRADFYGQDLGANQALFSNNSFPQTGNIIGSGGSGVYNDIDIDFGDGNIAYSIGSTVTHTYASAGTYYVCVTVTSMDTSLTLHCMDTYCDSVTVTSGAIPCQADFQAYPIGFNPNAVPVVVQFDDWSVGNNLSTWTWDFGDGTTGTGQNTTHSYIVPGTYWACLTVEELDSNGLVLCTDTYCDSVWADTLSINPPSCYADFMNNQVAISDSTYFTNLSLAPTTATYYWDFGDGTTSTLENPVHLFATSGWYNVCLTIMDSATNCYDTYCSYINIVVGGSTGCQAYFYGMPSQTAPNAYDFLDYSAGNITNWLWDFGDGTTSTQQNPTHTYSSTGTGFYSVCLTVTELDATGAIICTDTYCDSIYVWNSAVCQADFYGQNLGNNEVLFTNLTYPQTGNANGTYNYVDIDFGDGTIDYNIPSTVNHTYASPGTYYVCVTVTSMDSSFTVLCTDTYCDSVTVTSGTMPCQADFVSYIDSNIIFNPNGTTSMGSMFYFIDLSTPMGMIESWQWDMGDSGAGTYLQGTSDTSQMPMYEYDTNGIYYVCLTITTLGGQCTSITCDSIDFSMMQGGQTALEEINVFKNLELYPNPVKDRLTVELSTANSGDLTFKIMNMLGQPVYVKQANLVSGTNSYSIDVSQITNGIYSLELITGVEKQYQRIVISR